MGAPVNMVDGNGNVVHVDESGVAEALSLGFHLETAGEQTGRNVNEVKEDIYGGAAGKIATFGTRALGTATLGASDALLSALGAGEDLQALREVNPTTATLGSLAGAVVPLIPGIGAARYLPGGAASRVAADIAGLGEGAGFAARVAANAGGAAFEGAAQNAGAYISDVALGDRDLSAEGFAGAMGQGAFWGGAAGGALTLASGGLTAARRLFPKVEMSAANVAKVEREAVEEIGRAVEDGATLEHATAERINEIATERSLTDPGFATRIREAKARELAARVDTAEAKAATAEERAWRAKSKSAEVRDATKVTRKTRKAMAGEEPAPPPPPSATAVAEDVAPATTSMSSLERQLQGTKEALDAGQALAQIGGGVRKAAPTVDVTMAEIAKVDPEARKLVEALGEMKASREGVDAWLAKHGGKESQVARFERSQAARDYAEGMRPKAEGFYTKLPAGEPKSNALVQRGYQKEWRGSEEGRLAAEARINAKVPAEERAQIDEMFARRRAGRIADEVVSPPPPSVDEQVSGAIKAKVPDINADIAEHAPAISRYEAASAEVTEILGPRAPISAQDRTKAFREAQTAHEAKSATAAVNTAADIDNATSVASLPGAPGKASALDSIKSGADVWQALHMMGVPLPDPKDVPVIGPLLGMYLKARVLGKAFGRFGGKVAETAETVIATKAALTKQRVYTAVDKLLDASSRAVAKAAPQVGGVAAVLAHSLFQPEGGQKVTPKKTDLPALYQARSDELAAAMAPGAVRDAVRARVRVTDPVLLDAIVAAKEKKLTYLHETMPKADQPPGLLSGVTEWTPNKAALSSWTRRIEAAEDPAGVLETAAQGGAVSIEAAETLKKVFPRLYQEAQMRLLSKVTDGTARTIPYARRLQLSMLFDLPLDGSQHPETAAFLQAGYKPPPPTQGPSPLPMTPTVASDVRSANRTDPGARNRPL